jgi:hypothetical protein
MLFGQTAPDLHRLTGRRRMLPSILIALPTAGVLGMLTLLGALLWVMLDVTDRLRPRVFLFILAIPLYGFFCERLLQMENAWLPVKYDPWLHRMDAALGFSAATVARWFHGTPAGTLLAGVYRSLLIAMAAWYGMNLRRLRGPSILWAFAAQMVVGPCLYALLPACGPLYAMPGFPENPAGPGLDPLRLSGDPNAIPSLHMSTALLLVIFARSRNWRIAAAVYAAAIALSTIVVGEHYAIDLVVGLPFACYAAAAANRRMGTAALYLGLVAAWLASIRTAAPLLALHPGWLKLGVLLTVAVSLYGAGLLGSAPAGRKFAAVAAGAPERVPEGAVR